jgi:hypothetical protein
MTTDNDFQLNAEATLQAMAKIIQQAQGEAEHANLIEALKQDRLCVEGEAFSTGQIHARRMLSDNPDYPRLCRMMDEAREFTDPEYDGLLPDEDPAIADHDFQLDLLNYPEALQGAMFAGFYTEVQNIFNEVSK